MAQQTVAHNPTARFASSVSALPKRITYEASKQTFYTIRLLVDHDRVLSAFRAYAYFRWVDDHIDQQAAVPSEQLAFIESQTALMNCCYRGEHPGDLCGEEQLLIDLIASDHEPQSGLRSYIRNMMAVMAFDARRRGRVISEAELARYARQLGTAVTDALHYFIGHDSMPPQDEARYLPAIAAHITHMLRDTYEDVALGYFNVPREFLVAHGLAPTDISSDVYRAWVRHRVRLARDYFHRGESYLAQVPNLRCRIAGYTYMARFTSVLDAIEKDDFRLRPAYPEMKTLKTGIKMGVAVLADALRLSASGRTDKAALLQVRPWDAR